MTPVRGDSWTSGSRPGEMLGTVRGVAAGDVVFPIGVLLSSKQGTRAHDNARICCGAAGWACSLSSLGVGDERDASDRASRLAGRRAR